MISPAASGRRPESDTREAVRRATASRVLFVIDELATASAGTETQLLELLRGLNGSAFEPHLAVFRRSDYLDQSVMPCPVHRLGVDRLASRRGLAGLTALSQLARSLEARVAHTFFTDASIAAPFFCRLGGARVIAARRDMGFWYTAANLRALRLSNRFVDLIAANSEAVKQNVHHREGFPLERIHVIPNGHDARRFDAPPAPGFRERFGIADGDKVIGMVANLNARKRHFDLIRALPAIHERSGPAHLVLAGQGPEAETLRQLARSLNLERWVHLLQDTSEVVPTVKHFDVAVLCSDSEGLSNALIEYAFCGRAIVCTNVGGNPELITNGTSGLLVERGDVEGIAGAVVTLLRDVEQAARFGAAARATVQRHCTTRAMLDAHLSLYQATLSGRHEAPAGASHRH
jgi:glycosyltransferase involved in cell wall biosynthesis